MDPLLNRSYKNTIDKKYSILYVDDEEVNLRIFQRAFKRHYEVYTANCGPDAMNILKNNAVDLIMTDQRMPRMSGAELLIKIVPQYPNIARMIMTGFSDEEEIMRVDDEVGLDRYMVKPWNKDDLMDEFKRALERRNTEKKSDEVVQEEPILEEEKPVIDFVESTLSMVEQGAEEETDLSDFEEDLLERPIVQTSQMNVDDDQSHNVNLLEALLPNQQELKLYTEDSFINFEHYAVSKNAYWFGENDQKFIVASTNTMATIKKALALNIFTCACLTELVYKEGLSSPIEIISNLSMRVNHRFFNTSSFNKDYSLDIAIMAYDDQADQLLYCGANHDLYYFDSESEFHSLKSENSSIMPGVPTEYHSQVLTASEVSEIYFVPNNVINQNKSKIDGESHVLTAKKLLEEIHKFPMSMQVKLLKDYKYGSIIGIRF